MNEDGLRDTSRAGILYSNGYDSSANTQPPPPTHTRRGSLERCNSTSVVYTSRVQCYWWRTDSARKAWKSSRTSRKGSWPQTASIHPPTHPPPFSNIFRQCSNYAIVSHDNPVLSSSFWTYHQCWRPVLFLVYKVCLEPSMISAIPFTNDEAWNPSEATVSPVSPLKHDENIGVRPFVWCNAFHTLFSSLRALHLP